MVHIQGVSRFRKILPWLLGVGVIVYLAGWGTNRGPVETAHVLTVTEATFAKDVEQAETWVLVDFWATWCGPCRALLPVLDAVAPEYEGRVTFVKVEVEENPRLAERFHIQSIPHVYLFKDGEPVTGFLGYRNRSQVREWIDTHIAQDDDRNI